MQLRASAKPFVPFVPSGSYREGKQRSQEELASNRNGRGDMLIKQIARGAALSKSESQRGQADVQPQSQSQPQPQQQLQPLPVGAVKGSGAGQTKRDPNRGMTTSKGVPQTNSKELKALPLQGVSHELQMWKLKTEHEKLKPGQQGLTVSDKSSESGSTEEGSDCRGEGDSRSKQESVDSSRLSTSSCSSECLDSEYVFSMEAVFCPYCIRQRECVFHTTWVKPSELLKPAAPAVAAVAAAPTGAARANAAAVAAAVTAKPKSKSKSKSKSDVMKPTLDAATVAALTSAATTPEERCAVASLLL